MQDAPYLVISDLQIPFEHEKALSFCVKLQKFYKVPDDNILNVGDELDCLHGGLYPKDPNASHTPKGEIKEAKEKLKEWSAHFPKMKLAISNHGMRWFKKASHAEIPTELIREYRDVFDLPKGWVWQNSWTFKEKHPFRMIHGMGYSGMSGHRTAALDGGISTLIGHLHSHAGIAHIATSGQRLWGMNVGCLIDTESYAFAYGKDSRFKPCLGAGIIANQGRTPIWIPLD